MLLLIAVELALILVGLVACVVVIARESRRVNRRNDQLVALIIEAIGVEGEIAEAAKSTAQLTETLEVEARQTRKATEGLERERGASIRRPS